MKDNIVQCTSIFHSHPSRNSHPPCYFSVLFFTFILFFFYFSDQTGIYESLSDLMKSSTEDHERHFEREYDEPTS